MNSAPRQYCLTLNLRDDEDLIREYEAFHSPGNVWPEIVESIRSAGILDMQIYRTGVQLVMVIAVSDEFSFERKAKMDSENPKVVEWERLMEKFQRVDEPGDSKWTSMKDIFNLQDHI